MFNWLREYFELRYEFKERKQVCSSCEVLKQQLAIANIERDKLLNRILEKPTEEPRVEKKEEPQIIRPHIPWHTQRQMIEQEDREKAKLLRDAPRPEKIKTDDLEKELLNAESNRTQSKS